ncbi:MAG: DNA-processing protein DprA [Gammaproteobacteria bacterium]
MRGEGGLPVAGAPGDPSTLAWLVLARVPFSPGSRPGLHELLDRLGPEGVLEAGVGEWRAHGVNAAAIAALREAPWTAARADELWARTVDAGAQRQSCGVPAGDATTPPTQGCHIVHFGCEDYPPRLREIADPPLVLFVRGRLKSLTAPQVAIVGSRRATMVGRRAAFAFARDLAAAGLGVTSGLAAGIDASAHEGALAGGGLTTAVMGTGPDRVYPARHARLSLDVAAHGALVSEFAPGTPPSAFNFPRRNRLISGLALGVVVVEAARRSGSLITARLAAEQGREVFAVPGSVNNPMAAGCHGLLRQGATLATDACDVIAELAPILHNLISDGPISDGPISDGPISDGIDAGAGTGRTAPVTPSGAAAPPAYSGDAARLLDALEFHLEPFDDVVARSGLTPEAASSMLLMLELDGIVDTAPGGYCCRVR